MGASLGAGGGAEVGATAVVAATAVGSHRDREEDGGSLQGSAPLLLPVCDAIITGGGREMKWGGGDEAFGVVGGGRRGHISYLAGI